MPSAVAVAGVVRTRSPIWIDFDDNNFRFPGHGNVFIDSYQTHHPSASIAMLSAAIRVLARAATIQLEEAAAAHPRPPPSLLKGKERAIPLRRHDPPVSETDMGVGAAGSSRQGAPVSVVEEVQPIRKASSAPGLEEQFETLTSEVSGESRGTETPRPAVSTPSPFDADPRSETRPPIDRPSFTPAVTEPISNKTPAMDRAEGSADHISPEPLLPTGAEPSAGDLTTPIGEAPPLSAEDAEDVSAY